MREREKRIRKWNGRNVKRKRVKRKGTFMWSFRLIHIIYRCSSKIERRISRTPLVFTCSLSVLLLWEERRDGTWWMVGQCERRSRREEEKSGEIGVERRKGDREKGRERERYKDGERERERERLV